MDTPPPITIRAGAWLPGDGLLTGYPNGVTYPPLPGRLESWEHSVAATGGEETASARLTAPLPLAYQWLGVVGGTLTAYDRGAQRVFAGTVTTVEINDGSVARTLTTDGMANAVLVAYTKSGVPKATALAENSDSRSRYHRRMLVYGAGEMDSTRAAAARDSLLAALAWPLERTGAELTSRPSRGEASVAVTVRGWWHTLSWTAVKVGRKTGNTAAHTLLINLVNDSISSPLPGSYGNTVFSFAASSLFVTYTGPSTDSGAGPMAGIGGTALFPQTREYEYASEAAGRLLSLNTSAGKKVAYGFNLELHRAIGMTALHYLDARVWAGDTPTTIGLYVRPPSGLYWGGGGVFPWTRVRPDVMAQVLGGGVRPPLPGTAVDAGGRFWVARVTYRWARGQGEQLTLEPEGQLDPAAVLARVR